MNYIKDDKSYIDHTYMWDIITQPNSDLINDGLNLTIIQIVKNDVVELMCPTSAYSTTSFDSTKNTLILLKQDDYYEPIYSYTINEKSIKVKKDFSEHDPTLSKTMREIFRIWGWG